MHAFLSITLAAKTEMVSRRAFLHRSGAVGLTTSSSSLRWFHQSNEEKFHDRVEDKIDEFLDEVDQESVAENIARSFCEKYRGLKDDITITKEEPAPHEIRDQLRHAEDVLTELEGVLGTTIDTKPIEVVRKADNAAKLLAKGVPLLGSVKSIIENACTLHRLLPDDEVRKVAKETRAEIKSAKTNLLIACGTLIVQLLAIQLAVTYRLSFIGTRVLANRALVHVRGLIGLRLYSALLREVHWYLRDEFSELITDTIRFIAQKTKEIIETEGCYVYRRAFNPDDLELITEADSPRNIRDDGLFGVDIDVEFLERRDDPGEHQFYDICQ